MVFARETSWASPWSGRQSFHQPVLFVAAITQPIVQPVDSALPEFHRIRHNTVTAPEIGHRHRRTLRPALFQPRVRILDLGPGRDHRRLPAPPAPALTAVP